jgi:DNA-binding transcriptional regulator YdaS (Cro superfamily)
MTPIERAVECLGGISATGRAIGVTHEAVRHWIRGSNRITAERALQIEAATAGAVTRADLRPDLFADQAKAA